jgi:hypothetical protein
MAALADRVKESTATTGQGTVTLAGAAVGFRSFTAAFGNGVSVYYVIAGGAEWEVGIGTTGAGTLSRDTVIGSSAGGTTKVTFSAGTKDVFCSVPASRLVLTDNLASANTANAVVQRDGSGNFAAGTITATLSGSITGNAATATALQTARNINGVSFNGTADITVTAAAGTLSGNTLASGVTASSLTSVGTLSSLTVSGDLTVDTSTLKVDSANNRVGIKQATPLHPLHVGTTDLILDTSGNLGLGVTPSAWSVLTPALQFGGGGAFIAAQTTTPALYTGMNAHFNGTSWVYKVDGTATYVLQFNGAHSWFTAASGLAGNTITFTERVRVDGTTTAGETALLLWDVDNGALERVTVGAADSGGVGYKVLRIPN